MDITQCAELLKKSYCLDFRPICGVYLLMQDNKIVYVGQSIHVQTRVLMHYRPQNEEAKKFNRVIVLPCSENELDDFELTIIKAFKPIYNRQGIKGKCKMWSGGNVYN